jgi:hypothetical protein
MAADSRLRKLQDVAQLAHGQFVPLEHEQHPASRRIGQGAE